MLIAVDTHHDIRIIYQLETAPTDVRAKNNGIHWYTSTFGDVLISSVLPCAVFVTMIVFRETTPALYAYHLNRVPGKVTNESL